MLYLPSLSGALADSDTVLLQIVVLITQGVKAKEFHEVYLINSSIHGTRYIRENQSGIPAGIANEV